MHPVISEIARPDAMACSHEEMRAVMNEMVHRGTNEMP